MVNSKESILILFRKVYENDQKSFNSIFELFYERLLNSCIYYVKTKEAAEEIVSDVFVKLWQNRHHLNTVAKPEVYLFTAVKNNALNYLRNFSNCKIVCLNESQGKDAALLWDNPEEALERKEIYLKMQQAIERLPTQSKLIFRLVKEEGLKCKEVAEILQISTRSVENQVFRAIHKLDKALAPFLEKKVAVKKMAIVLHQLFFC